MNGSESQWTAPFGEARIQWGGFLRALAIQLDIVAGAAARDTLLRSVGGRMAALRPVPAVLSMEALEAEMNEILGELGWGRGSLMLDEQERRVMITHLGLPTVGSAGEPSRTWMVAALEGLYEGWFQQQQNAVPDLVVRRHDVESPQRIMLFYGRAETLSGRPQWKD